MNNIKVLVVEDEGSIRSFIKLNLEMAGFRVEEAGSGEEAVSRITSCIPDIVVLDIMLPGIDGYDVCRYIRKEAPGCFIIMLTAKGQDTDKIMGLELGADDYMVKPFNPFELIARIKAMLRRRVTIDVNITSYAFENLLLDIRGNRLFKDDMEVVLTPIEFSLLKMFMENPGKVLKRDELLNEVWGQDYFGDTKTLDVHIRRLREKVEDNPSEPAFIRTVWGLGYRWQSKPDRGRS
ncbi:MAG TPA: response regulator transcription factor [Anaerovoracaceae bacterium]|nr:response regulator transcription factor [Anaerovoracaceae bacterium]